MDQEELLELILNHFNEEELKTLCFKLRIDYGDLEGVGRAGKARELVAYCARHNRIAELETRCKQLRPNELREPIQEDVEAKPRSIEIDTYLEHELKYRPKLSTQVKLVASLQNDDMTDLIETIKSALGIADSYILKAMEPEGLHDVYHDTEDLDLFNENSSFRIRHSGKDTKITIKKNRSVVGGEFKRDEDSITCDQETLQRHIKKNFVEITQHELPHLLGKKLKPVIIVKNSRRLFIMKPKDESQTVDGFIAKLSFDIYTIVNARTGRASDEMYELEIEAMNKSGDQRLTDIAKNINAIIPELVASKMSKYENGVSYFKLTSSQIVQSFFNWGRGPGFNWISLSMFIFSLILITVALFIMY